MNEVVVIDIYVKVTSSLFLFGLFEKIYCNIRQPRLLATALVA